MKVSMKNILLGNEAPYIKKNYLIFFSFFLYLYHEQCDAKHGPVHKQPWSQLKLKESDQTNEYNDIYIFHNEMNNLCLIKTRTNPDAI